MIKKFESYINNFQVKVNNEKAKKEAILSLQNKIVNTKKLINESKKIIEGCRALDIKEKEILNIEQQMKEYMEKAKTLNDKKEKLLSFKKIVVDEKQGLKKGKEYLQNTISEIEILIQNTLNSIKHLGKCPTCFSDIDDNHLEKVKRELE